MLVCGGARRGPKGKRKRGKDARLKGAPIEGDQGVIVGPKASTGETVGKRLNARETKS